MSDGNDDSGGNDGPSSDEEEVTSVIRYDFMVQDAMQSVVREALDYARRCGLPTGHHFYITFATDHLGVDIPDRLKDKYPEEMTIVLQHEFWDLEVVARWFSVSMSFDGIPANLTIPYAAIKNFYDPYVKFGLQFTIFPPDEEDEAGDDSDGESTAPEDKEANSGYTSERPEEAAEPEAGQVVSLDAFRKK